MKTRYFVTALVVMAVTTMVACNDGAQWEEAYNYHWERPPLPVEYDTIIEKCADSTIILNITRRMVMVDTTWVDSGIVAGPEVYYQYKVDSIKEAEMEARGVSVYVFINLDRLPDIRVLRARPLIDTTLGLIWGSFVTWSYFDQNSTWVVDTVIGGSQ